MGLPNDLTEEEIAEFLAMPKFMDEDLNWRKESAHSAIAWTAAPLLTEQGATISGHMVDIEYRHSRYKDECKYTFTIFRLHPRRTRLYQIEVVPPDHKSYVANGKSVYGPHQHFGERHAPLDEKFSCAQHEEWFRVFLRRANIGFSGKYFPPVIIEDMFK